ncbi:hypothetical protein EVAR_27049_1 [Eumeta japonica]|uniref:Uncharacterized protein n=1 Tax=Eumeta variegata TaxID=151549 RepID=A0A4C1WGT9_EUMVA|nr:hypothetical protein EVAR_27049_1 [Eumeta japonica]
MKNRVFDRPEWGSCLLQTLFCRSVSGREHAVAVAWVKTVEANVTADEIAIESSPDMVDMIQIKICGWFSSVMPL